MRALPALAAVSLVAVALCLGGCASEGIVIHRLPAETPAADNAAAIQKAASLAAAAKAAAEREAQAKAQATASGQAPDEVPKPLTAADAPSYKTYDPWERMNRFTYRFNARFDEAIFLPAANGYRYLPSTVRAGVHNFFGNLNEVSSVVNYTLQGRLGRGVRSLERFAINSTIGIGGLFDVATKFHLPGSPTGFGTTLSQWGMHPGPFFVIPILGPSTLRQSVGLASDYALKWGVNVGGLYRGNVAWALTFVTALDQRANINFRYYSTGSPFEYGNIRFLYVRKLLLEDAGLHRKDPPKKRDADIPAGQ
jgi:phospholipid-binding lipoprotein MlaA